MQAVKQVRPTKVRAAIALRNAYGAGLVSEAQMKRRVEGIITMYPSSHATREESRRILRNLMYRYRNHVEIGEAI